MFVDIGYGLRVRADMVEAVWQPQKGATLESLAVSGWRGSLIPCAIVEMSSGARYGSPFVARTVVERIERALDRTAQAGKAEEG